MIGRRLSWTAYIVLPIMAFVLPAFPGARVPICDLDKTNCNGTFKALQTFSSCYNLGTGCCEAIYQLGSCNGSGNNWWRCAIPDFGTPWLANKKCGGWYELRLHR